MEEVFNMTMLKEALMSITIGPFEPPNQNAIPGILLPESGRMKRIS
jgi:hypothetical protein